MLSYLTRRGDNDLYDMHSLVHLAMRVWIRKEAQMEETILNSLKHIEAVFPNNDYVTNKYSETTFYTLFGYWNEARLTTLITDFSFLFILESAFLMIGS